MKKIIYLFSTVFVLWSCTQGKSDSENHGASKDSMDADVSLSKMDMVEELANVDEECHVLFNASGTEPGWMADFYKDKIRLIVNSGRDSVIMERDNKDLNDKADIKIKLPSGASDMMLIENKSCTAISGDIRERTVTLKCMGKDYTGCGSFKK